MTSNRKTPTQIGIEKALAGGRALRARQIAQEIGYSYDGVWETLRKMRGMVHIASWERIDAWHWAPAYRLGSAMDAPKPEPLSSIEVDRRRRRRQGIQERPRFDGDLEIQLELELARKAREALSQPAFRHPHDIAFFGEPFRRAM